MWKSHNCYDVLLVYQHLQDHLILSLLKILASISHLGIFQLCWNRSFPNSCKQKPLFLATRTMHFVWMLTVLWNVTVSCDSSFFINQDNALVSNVAFVSLIIFIASVCRRRRDTNSSWKQQPGEPRTDPLWVLYIYISQDPLGISNYFVSLILLDWNNTDCQNHIQELWLSIFHDLVFYKLEYYVFSRLLFWTFCNCPGKAVSNQKIQVGF